MKAERVWDREGDPPPKTKQERELEEARLAVGYMGDHVAAILDNKDIPELVEIHARAALKYVALIESR